MPKSELEKLWDQANDPLLAFLLAVAILSLLLLIPSLWVVVWSVLASFLAFDFLMKRFIKGGSGIFQSALSGSTAAQSKGHAFLTLFAIVMFVTIASSILAESIADGIRASPIAGVMATLSFLLRYGSTWIENTFADLVISLPQKINPDRIAVLKMR